MIATRLERLARKIFCSLRLTNRQNLNKMPVLSPIEFKFVFTDASLLIEDIAKRKAGSKERENVLFNLYRNPIPAAPFIYIDFKPWILSVEEFFAPVEVAIVVSIFPLVKKLNEMPAPGNILNLPVVKIYLA